MNTQENWKQFKQLPWKTFNPKVGTFNDRGWILHMVSDLGRVKIGYFDHEWTLVKETPVALHWKGNQGSKWLGIPTGPYVHR